MDPTAISPENLENFLRGKPLAFPPPAPACRQGGLGSDSLSPYTVGYIGIHVFALARRNRQWSVTGRVGPR